MLEVLKNKKGFTLMEVMVSFSIITLGLVGAMSLASQNIQAEEINKNTIIATELAQEGLELVRNKRDNNWLKEENWIYSSSTASDFDIIQDGSYTVDYSGNIDGGPDNIDDNNSRLYLDSQGFFIHNSAFKSTIFSRLIKSEILDDHSVRISCIVRWRKGNNNHDIVIFTELFDWR